MMPHTGLPGQHASGWGAHQQWFPEGQFPSVQQGQGMQGSVAGFTQNAGPNQYQLQQPSWVAANPPPQMQTSWQQWQQPPAAPPMWPNQAPQWPANQQQWPQPNNFQSSWGSMPGQMIPPLPPTNPQQAPPPPPPEDSMPMSEAEREFDKQFKEWEAKFAVWKEENKNHPDKKALAEYEAQWNTWREHLLANREQLRRQRAESMKQTAPVVPPVQQNKTGRPDLSKPIIGPQLPRSEPNNQPAGPPVKDSGSNYPPSHFQAPKAQAQADQTYPHGSRGRDDGVPPYMGRPPPHHPSGGYHEDPSYMDHSRTIDYPRDHQPYEEYPPYDDYPQPGGYRPPRPDGPHRDLPFQRDMGPSGRHPVPLMSMPPGIRPLPDSYANDGYRGEPARFNAGPEQMEEEPFTPIPAGETAASMFRKRALRGKGADPASAAPVGQRNQTFHQEPSASNALPPRPRIEERLAVHADIKLSSAPSAQQAEPKPVEREVIVPPVKEFIPIVKDYSNLAPKKVIPPKFSATEPVVIEYHHRPAKSLNDRFASDGPVLVDYSHGKRPRLDPDATTRPPIPPVNPPTQPVKPLATPEKKAAVEVNSSPSIKQAPLPPPPQLFPSAAAIQEAEAQRSLPQSLPNPAVDGLFLKVPDPPKLDSAPVEFDIVTVEDLLNPPGRYGRPCKMVVILRGLPGSGKSHVARLIKEKEVLMGGSAPRILSIDDYYTMEDGSPVPWHEDQEEQYRQNLLKSLRRNLDDGHFPFVIVDALHLRASEVVEVASTARGRAFSVFLVDLPDRGIAGTTTRKCSEKDIEDMKSKWQEAPGELPRLDIQGLLMAQETGAVRTATPEDVVTSTTALLDDDSQEDSNGTPAVSKWETMEQTEEKLDRLDGIVKKKLEKPTSMEDWLQSGLPDDYVERKENDGKKRVRWADVEEKMQQKKMRDVGFVVGQTDWSRMTDPTFGESALTKTKYI